MATENRRPGYCPSHAEACEQWDRDFGPFPGCPDCPKPAGFDLKTQPHLLAAAAREKAAADGLIAEGTVHDG